MKIVLVIALIAATVSHGDAALGEDCLTKSTCPGCLADNKCTWCAAMIEPASGGTPTSLKLGYCTAKMLPGCSLALSNFGNLKFYGPSIVAKDVRQDLTSTCPDDNEPPNALVFSSSCARCKRPGRHWCQIDSVGARGGVCLKNLPTGGALSTTCEQLVGRMPSATGKALAPDFCPANPDCRNNSAKSSCSECGEDCNWCGLTLEDTNLTAANQIVPGSGTQLGTCVPKGDDVGTDVCVYIRPSEFGTIAKTLEYTKGDHEYKMVVKRFGNDAQAKLNGWAGSADCKATYVDPLATTWTSCKECTAAKAHWCQTKLDGKTAGGLCLGTDAAKAKALCYTFTKAGSDAFYKVTTESMDKCPAPPVTPTVPVVPVVPVDCPVKTSCKVCSAATACVWCGIAIQDTKLTAANKIVPGSGTQLGSCISKPTSTTASEACAAVIKTFGEIAKALEYTKGDHEYKMVTKPFEGTESEIKANGWESAAECKVTHVDPVATTKLTCDTCVKAKAHWCLTDLNDKAAGGVCLGVDAKRGEALCDSFAKPAKSDAFYSVATEIKDKCSANPGANPDAAFSVASASSVALLAAVVAAFLSVA